MPRILVVLIIPLLVTGCVMPLPLRVAAWAAEGVVYLATKKSFTDHGISAITGKDCALLRAATGEDICTDLEKGLPEGTMV
ncbi:MAG: hypothetical protein OQK53_00610, partial [Rhodospirillales bacterium]|nr:hypothetical protein [Rhodospirillales bacterium]